MALSTIFHFYVFFFTYLFSYNLYFYLYIEETDFFSYKNRLSFIAKQTYFHFGTDFFSWQNRHFFGFLGGNKSLFIAEKKSVLQCCGWAGQGRCKYRFLSQEMKESRLRVARRVTFTERKSVCMAEGKKKEALMGFGGKSAVFLISDNRLFFFCKKNKKRYKYYTMLR